MFDQLVLLGFAEGGWGQALLAGALVTISLALACLPFGVPLGLALALAERSRRRWPRALASVFSTVFRGLPELLTLLLVYYGCQIGAQKLLAHLGYPAEVAINAFVAAILALSLVFAAFSAQVWAGALNTASRGQYQAAAALGFGRASGFFLIILPQVTRTALPGLSNNWLTLLKDTSLVSTISLVDVMRQTQLAVSSTREPLLFYGAACVIYLVLAAASGQITAWLERHYSRHLKGARG